MPTEKLLLYSPGLSARLKYIASHIVNEMLGVELAFTSRLDEALSSAIPLINYSANPVPRAVNIYPHGLLLEENITKQTAEVDRSSGIPVIFRSGPDEDAGFDLFAASFFMLSRYEEYLSTEKDKHGRFPYKNSLACRFGVNDEPLVELWAGELKNKIFSRYPGIIFPERDFTFIPTIDIDNPWAYRNRSLWRTSGGFARSLAKGDLSGMRLRWRVLSGRADDPFDTWEVIYKIHREAGLSPLVFFSTGTYGRFDKCVPVQNPEYSRLVSTVTAKYPTGIHPSYFSCNDGELMQREIRQLAGITGNEVIRSRQHFLRLQLPGTYRLLAENGIKEDYTMGWAEVPGFRAGTCTPFLFYDLMREQVTSLTIWPFQIMDGTLRDYMGLDEKQSVDVAARIVKKIKDVNGTLITLWHNEAFSETGRWKNWNVYPEILRLAARGKEP
jgi:hypothetical protein